MFIHMWNKSNRNESFDPEEEEEEKEPLCVIFVLRLRNYGIASSRKKWEN